MPPGLPPFAALRRAPPALRLLAALGASASVAGCASAVSSRFPPPCPHAGILADAADMTRFRPGATGRDLTDMALDGRVTGVSGACTRNGRDTDVTVAVSMQLARGPAYRAAGSREVPFFVAVTRNRQVLDKQVYRVVPGFAPNADTTRLTTDPVTLTLPTNAQRPGSSYDVVVGFQLSPEEVAFNRRRGPR